MRATVAHVTADEPATAAMMPQPRMFTCSKRPGSQFTHGPSPLNMSSDRRVLKRISPIQMKSGNAVMGQPQLASHIDEIARDPAGASENTASPNMPSASNDKAIQTPLASKASRTVNSTPETRKTAN